VASILDAFRRRRSPPAARLAEAGVEKGMKVADLGAGYGFFAIPAAELVGEEGIVYAVEPNPKRAREVSRRAEEDGLRNVKVLVTGAEDLHEIPEASVDLAISMSSFHHFGDTQKALAEIGRAVRPGGRVYIRDMKAGRVFKHGSESEGFRRTITKQFPSAEFEEGPGYLVARIRVSGS
jgi:ubiquinone/menaquinone biosynthesis C-methylase UbiE